MSINELDKITPAYHNIQARRIDLLRRRIYGQKSAVSTGFALPEVEHLPIGSGRRLQAAVLFLDISDFTSRPSETADDQEISVRCLSLFFSEVVRIIEDYGGRVEKNTGDGVMAYFGSRSGSGDMRQRSLACSMSIFHATEKFINPIIANSGINPFAFRICIDFGWITIARMGAAQRFNHIVAVGATANRTAKMLNVARGGDILIGAEMLPGLPDHWNQSYVEVWGPLAGWTYPGGPEYHVFRFIGRWADPQP